MDMLLNLEILILGNYSKEIINVLKKCMNKDAIYKLIWNVM